MKTLSAAVVMIGGAFLAAAFAAVFAALVAPLPERVLLGPASLQPALVLLGLAFLWLTIAAVVATLGIRMHRSTLIGEATPRPSNPSRAAGIQRAVPLRQRTRSSRRLIRPTGQGLCSTADATRHLQ